MNLSESIESLFEQNVVELAIGKAPTGQMFVQAKHLIATGAEGNRSNIVHQTAAGSLVECVEQLKSQVAHCNELQTRIVQPRRNSN